MVYTAIIKEVVDSLKADFDEFGIGDEVLATLHEVSCQLYLSFQLSPQLDREFRVEFYTRG